MVRAVAISCVRDELDIIEPFVRHTLAHVHQLVVLDNGSTDGTRQLLQQLIDEGLPLEVVDDPTAGNYQWRRMTHLMRAHAIQKHAADWIVPLDVDEFLTVDDLPDFLNQETRGNHPIGISWRTYVPAAEDDSNEVNPVLRIRQRLREESRPTIKVIIPSKLARLPGVRIAQGNHFLEGDGQSIVTRVTSDAFLGHFPGRSPGQFARKVAVKHLQYLAMGDRQPSWGFHYRATVELLRKDLVRLDADFQRAILFYNIPEGESFQPELIVAPLAYRGGALKYTPAQPQGSLMQTLLECAEMIARSHGSYSKGQDALIADLQRKEAALAAMHRSTSWRIGRIVTSPVRWFRQRLKKSGSDDGGNDRTISHEMSRAA